MVRKRITSQDVADRAGVSRTTVSFVLNNVEAKISEETRLRVRQIAEDMGYVPNAAARALARRKTHTLALVLIRRAINLTSDAFLPSVMQGCIDVLRPAGFRLLLEPVAHADEPDVYLNLVRGRQIDGIILSGPRSDDIQLAELIDSGFPVVLLGQLPEKSANFVDVDNHQAARRAVEYLIKQGHKRIGCITNAPPQYTSAADRLEGYKDALAKYNIPFDAELVKFGNFIPESGHQAARTLLHKSDDHPTALFVASDVVAIGAMSAIQELGYSIPGDIALVGFDDVPMARFLSPPLTTMRLPALDLGRSAAKMILSCIQDNGSIPQQVFLNTELVVRESG
ncbi:MAG: LacI family DNA-binding transcriptional regulator [Anaerolineales bacterium]|nr:LacI family DNA-binding transcriptional regulator [Anaerolineales bacterium]